MAIEDNDSTAEDIALLTTEEEEDVSAIAETEEEEEIEDEPEEEEDEKEPPSDEPPATRHSFAELKKAFPDIAKKFPELRGVFYREQQFTSIFPTIADAQAAITAAEGYETISDDIISGDGSKFLEAVKETGQLKSFATKFLDKISTDKDLWWETVVSPVAEDIVKSFFKEGNRFASKEERENYQNAAQILSLFLFGDTKVAKGEVTFKKKAEETKSSEVDKEREKFNQERFEAFDTDVRGSAEKRLMSMVLEKDKNDKLRIDPQGSLSSFMKDTIAEKIAIEINKQLEKDTTHIQYMDGLWKKAREGGWTGAHKAKILDAFLARAKAILPAVRSRIVSEAIGKTPRIVENKRKEPGSSGKTPSSRRGPVDAKRVDWSKTSDMDLMDDKVTYK